MIQQHKTVHFLEMCAPNEVKVLDVCVTNFPQQTLFITQFMIIFLQYERTHRFIPLTSKQTFLDLS